MSMPTVAAIVRAQKGAWPEHWMGCDWDEARTRCWCCGFNRRLQRAHMHPAATGGPNDPGNFVLLCAECHREAPDLDREAMLTWLRETSSDLHGDRRWRAALELLRRSGISDDDVPAAIEAARRHAEAAGTHGGSFSPGTCTEIVRRALAEVADGA